MLNPLVLGIKLLCVIVGCALSLAGILTSNWANTNETNGSGCVVELDVHMGLHFLYEHVYITCGIESGTNFDKKALDCGSIDGKDCHDLNISRTSAIVACVATGLSFLLTLALVLRHRKYYRNKELVVFTSLSFITESIGAIFCLVAPEYFRRFLSNVDTYTVINPNTAQEYIYDVSWDLGFSWLLMVSGGVACMLSVVLTIFLYYQASKTQEELDDIPFI